MLTLKLNHLSTFATGTKAASFDCSFTKSDVELAISTQNRPASRKSAKKYFDFIIGSLDAPVMTITVLDLGNIATS